MEFRLAVADDLPQLEAVFGKLIEYMSASGISMWDEYYPCPFFAEDIERGDMYVLTDGATIASAFVLCPFDTEPDCESIGWEAPDARSFYLVRFGVNVDYLRKGIGKTMLRSAMALARDMGAEYLRLFVAEMNAPAVRLYEQCGFRRACGVYDLMVDEYSLPIREHGYEIRL
ncbi:MAG: GNAT family N-acetyltransferase [Clostridia bacterium]|nr:GNAT family N-acetyltransferase [Clostridia bacterium]